MCGIFGYLAASESEVVSSNRIQRTIDDLHHRGPDGQDSSAGPGYALCHTRLSFLDLSEAGSQPMWDAEQRYCLVYNGEIYNYRALRKELEALGCSFRTESDTEVLLYGLLLVGDAFLARAEGMFAFGLYDSARARIRIGRDRFGIKPLYYALTDAGIVFSSELRPFRHWMSVAPNAYSVSGYIAGAEVATQGPSLLNGVMHCPVGSVLEFGRDSQITVQEFFNVKNFGKKSESTRLQKLSDEKIIDELDEKLQQSVRDHMIADVPVGALCSGGVDSSLLLAMASKSSADLAIFHADVKGQHSERSAAEALAKFLKLDLQVVEIHDDDFLDSMAETLLHYETPFSYHPNSVPFLAVARLVQSHGIKAVLTGEGADECFLGYSYLPTAVAIGRYYAFLDFLRNLVHKIPRIGELAWRNPAKALPEIALLNGLDFVVDAKELDDGCAGMDAGSPRSVKLLGHHLRTLLHRNDRLGMAASIEARFPYLDHRVVDFAVNLRDDCKIRISAGAARESRHPFVFTKWVLRKVAERHIPSDLANRRKRGFPTSFFERMNVSAEYFVNSWVAETFALDSKKIQFLVSDGSRAFQNRLLLLDAWVRLHVLDNSVSEVRADIKRHAKIVSE